MSFESDLDRFGRKVELVARGVLARTVQEVRRSVVEGSELTGSPGQPRLTGELAASWKETVEGDEGHVFTADPAAPVIEAGVRAGRPLAIGPPGGPHSVKLTIAGAGRLVEAAAREVAG